MFHPSHVEEEGVEKWIGGNRSGGHAGGSRVYWPDLIRAKVEGAGEVYPKGRGVCLHAFCEEEGVEKWIGGNRRGGGVAEGERCI